MLKRCDISICFNRYWSRKRGWPLELVSKICWSRSKRLIISTNSLQSKFTIILIIGAMNNIFQFPYRNIYKVNFWHGCTICCLMIEALHIECSSNQHLHLPFTRVSSSSKNKINNANYFIVIKMETKLVQTDFVRVCLVFVYSRCTV